MTWYYLTKGVIKATPLAGSHIEFGVLRLAKSALSQLPLLVVSEPMTTNVVLPTKPLRWVRDEYESQDHYGNSTRTKDDVVEEEEEEEKGEEKKAKSKHVLEMPDTKKKKNMSLSSTTKKYYRPRVSSAYVFS